MKLPKVKTENIVVQNLKDEVLIYDLTTDQAFCLNDTSAKVFNACDGKRTFAELKVNSELTDDLIFLALDELKKKNLLDEETNYVSPFAGMSRREVIKKVGLASMVALPMVAGMTAPKAAQAASGRCSPSTGICLPPNSQVCANCFGRTIFITIYTSGDGTCSGTGEDGSYLCPSVVSNIQNGSDWRITSSS